MFFGYWHQTPVAAKILLQGLPPAASSYGSGSGSGGSGGGGILTPEAAAAMLSLPGPVLAKLEEEARLLASLRHPSIANFLAFSRMPACLLTEFCQRGSLMQVLEEAAKDPAAAAGLTWHRRLSMASGVAAAAAAALACCRALALPGLACGGCSVVCPGPGCLAGC